MGTTNKNSFVVFNDIKSTLDLMSNEQAGLLFKAMVNFQFDIEDTLPNDIKLLFSTFKEQFKRNKIKWENTKTERQKAGIKSGESRRTKGSRTKRTNVQFVEQNEQNEQTGTKRTVSVSVPVSVNENVNENIIPSVPNTRDDAFESFWKQYPADRRNNKKKCREIFHSCKDKELLQKAFDRYRKSDRFQKSYIQLSDRWFKDWETWAEDAEPEAKDYTW